MKSFFYCCFLSIIIVTFAYVNSQKVLETFTPQIRQMYRPYIRRARLEYDNFFNTYFTRAYNWYKRL